MPITWAQVRSTIIIPILIFQVFFAYSSNDQRAKPLHQELPNSSILAPNHSLLDELPRALEVVIEMIVEAAY
jgi:hypothetical protein